MNFFYKVMNFFLHGHDFLGLQSQQVVHTLDILVVDLLQLGLSVLLKVLRQTVFDLFSAYRL